MTSKFVTDELSELSNQIIFLHRILFQRDILIGILFFVLMFFLSIIF